MAGTDLKSLIFNWKFIIFSDGGRQEPVRLRPHLHRGKGTAAGWGDHDSDDNEDDTDDRDGNGDDRDDDYDMIVMIMVMIVMIMVMIVLIMAMIVMIMVMNVMIRVMNVMIMVMIFVQSKFGGLLKTRLLLPIFFA